MNTKEIQQVQAIQAIQQQNNKLLEQIALQKLQYNKLHNKYEKSLKQLSLIVKANQTLKHDYDELQFHMNTIIQQKTQVNNRQLKQYIKKQLDQLNQTIEKLNDENQQTKIQKNNLIIKLNTIELQKNKINKEKQDITKNYEVLKAQLENLDPQTKDNQKSKSIENLKQKSRLADHLQQAVNELKRQKQEIRLQFQEKLAQIQKLWKEWHDFQNQINKTNEIKLQQKDYFQSSRKSISPKKQHKLKGSVIYQTGMNLLRKNSPNQQLRKTHPGYSNQQAYISLNNEQIHKLSVKMEKIQKQNEILKEDYQSLEYKQKIIDQLKKSNSKLSEEKMLIQQQLEQSKITKILGKSVKVIQNEQNNVVRGASFKGVQQQQDLISILKSLNDQLSPLRRQLIVLRKQQTQKNMASSNDKANFQIKIIRLQKQLSFYKQHNEMLKKQAILFKSQKQLISELQKKLQQTQEQKNILEGRIIVMESLNIIDHSRVGSQTYNTLKQFQKRIQLLIQDPHILKDLQGNHLQQLIAMKAYILQLDQRLKQIAHQNQKLTKKYGGSKQKIFHLNIQLKQVQNRQMTKILIYKQKIQAYDKLVQKLTLQLQRNIARNKNQQNENARISSEAEFNQVVNLYEQKMINMGQQIVKIRKDKQIFENELKQLRLQLNKKIRQLNDKERDIVLSKTQNINLHNYKGNLEKQLLQLRIQNQFYKQNKQYKGQSLQKSRFISILEQENLQLRHRYEEQYGRMRQNYENQIILLRKSVHQFENKLNQLAYEKIKQQQTAQKPNEQKKPSSSSKYKALIEQLTKQYEIKLSQGSEQKKKIIQQKQQQILQLQSQIAKIKQISNSSSFKLKQFQEIISQKEADIHQLEQVILKNNYEISLLRNEKKIHNYHQIQNQSLRNQQTQLFLDQNQKIHNQLYQKNVKISGLESTIYNLKLENQRLKTEQEMLEERLQKIQTELKIKNSKIFQIQNQLRLLKNSQDSSAMEKDSLIRSYENQVKNLKFNFEDLQRAKNTQKQKNQSRIKQLQQNIHSKEVSQSYIYNEDQTPASPQKITEIQSYKIQIKEFTHQLIEQSKISMQFNAKIHQLQSQLKYTLLELQKRNKEVEQFEQKLISYRQNNSEIQSNIQDEFQSLNTQILTLRATIITLRDEIQFKESKNSQLKHQIYILKLENKRLQKYQQQSNTIRNSNTLRNSQQQSSLYQLQQTLQQVKQQQNQSYIIINELKNELSELRQKNQKFQQNQNNIFQTIKQMNNHIDRLTQQLKEKQQKQQQKNQQIIQQLERLRRMGNYSQSQRCKILAQQIQSMQKSIQILKTEYQQQIMALKIKNKSIEDQLIGKNRKLSEIQLKCIELQNKTIESNIKQIQNKIQNKIQNNNSKDINYLVKQVQRLTLIEQQKKKKIQQLNILVIKYQSQYGRYKQNLNLIVLLIIEIQSLRNQLNQKQQKFLHTYQQDLKTLKVKKISSVQGLVDFQLIKQLQCSHENLMNYQVNNHNHKRTQQNSNDLINSYSRIDQMRQQQVISYPSQSQVQSNNIDSTYSIKNPFKNYYRHAQSSYNPLSFSPKSPSYQPQPQSINTNNVILGSFGKISESHNIQSSYGSAKSGLQSSNYLPNGNNERESGGYTYTLKNVNMISSVRENEASSSKNLISSLHGNIENIKDYEFSPKYRDNNQSVSSIQYKNQNPLTNSQSNLMNSQSNLMNSQSNLMNSQSPLIDSRKNMVNSVNIALSRNSASDSPSKYNFIKKDSNKNVKEYYLDNNSSQYNSSAINYQTYNASSVGSNSNNYLSSYPYSNIKFETNSYSTYVPSYTFPQSTKSTVYQ